MLGDDIQITDSSLTGVKLVEHIHAEYEARGLDLPYVPDHLVTPLRQADSKYFFATEDSVPLPLDFIPAWLSALTEPDDDEVKRLVRRDYLFFGEAGYGTNSYFFYYYLHWGRIYLFYLAPFGGIYLGHDNAAARINAEQADIARALTHCAGYPSGTETPLVIVADAKSLSYGQGIISNGELDAWRECPLAEALNALAAH